MPYRDTDKRYRYNVAYTEKHREEINAYNRARYAANPTVQKRATLNWRKKNRSRYNESCRKWMNANRSRLYDRNTPEGIARFRRDNANRRRYRAILKKEILGHYGKSGKVKCCWPHCPVSDIDMLTLDHINNDGAAHRKMYGSLGKAAHLYRHLKRDGFPSGYQTLCFNHQIKKEFLRKRETQND